MLRQEVPAIRIEGAEIWDLPCPLAGERFATTKLSLQRVTFEGGDGLDLAVLAPAYNRQLGQSLLARDICAIRDAAVRILTERGYLAQVRIPPQRLDSGTLSMTIVLARLVALRVRGNARHSRSLLSKYLQPLHQSGPFNTHEAERQIRLANSIPGYRVSLTLQQAETGVEGDLVGILTTEFQRVRANVSVTNYNPPPKRWLTTAGVELNSLLGWGDRTYIAVFSTPDKKTLKGFQVGQDFKFGTSGIGLSFDFVRAEGQPLRTEDLKLKDDVTIGRAEGTYSFYPSRGATVTAGVGIDYSDRLVSLFGPLFEDNLRIAFARLSFDSRPSTSGYSAWSDTPRLSMSGFVELRQGLNILGATKPCGTGLDCFFLEGVPPSRFDGDPTAFVVRLAGTVEYKPTTKFALRLRPLGQYTSSALLADEKFVVGPYTIGRGYPQGAAEGDAALAIAAEAEFGEQPRSSRDFAVSVYTFVDYANLVSRRQSEPSTETIISVGGGLRAAVGDRARLDAALALPLKNLEFAREKGDMKLLISFTSSLVPLPF